MARAERQLGGETGVSYAPLPLGQSRRGMASPRDRDNVRSGSMRVGKKAEPARGQWAGS